MRDSQLFDQAVKGFFEPIAQKLRLPLSRVEDGVYEMPSPYFILRIRLHTGHARGLNVILRDAALRDFSETAPFVQYGIGCFIEFYGEKLEDTFIKVDTDEDFLEQARLLAQATERFCIPYLLGKGNDFDAIREVYRKRAQEHVKELSGYRFPKNVRKEWK